MIAFFASPLGRAAVALLVFGALVGWAKAEQSWRHAAELRAAQAEAAVAGRDLAIAVLERVGAAAEARAASFNAIRRTVDAAPTSRACADSPAVRAALAGLRDRPGAAGGAGQPAGVPSRAGGAGRPQ